jgi:hypothetical protein
MSDKYKMEGHQINDWRVGGKLVCRVCGLVALNNELSRYAVKLGCNYGDHPSWVATVKRLTGHNGPYRD